MPKRTTEQILHITDLLSRNYAQFPFDYEHQAPGTALTALMEKCTSAGSERKDDLAILSQYFDAVVQLDCFTYRAVNKQADSDPIYWNSLLQTFDDFCNSTTAIYQTDTPFPTSDMIIAWCRRQNV